MPAPWVIALWKAFFGALAGADAGAAPVGTGPEVRTTNIGSGRVAAEAAAGSAGWDGDVPGSFAVGFDLPSVEGLATSMRFRPGFPQFGVSTAYLRL
jgi:hypothetical protein